METLCLLCSDLDRTLLPNGDAKESALARPVFRRIAAHPALMLAYVSGRDIGRVDAAMAEYDLPRPNYALTDVGSAIYEWRDDGWRRDRYWDAHIGADWKMHEPADLHALLADMGDLELQDASRQSRYKLSYYTPPDIDHDRLVDAVEGRLDGEGIRASIIWSLDEQDNRGLLDILPRRADKLKAIRFLGRATAMDPGRLVFAGDSGNDLAVLTSGVNSVLVANAHPSVRERAVAGTRDAGVGDSLYLATDGFMGMNGNYAAGVIQGLAHFCPETAAWIEDAIRDLRSGAG